MAAIILPGDMARLWAALAAPVPMSLFCKKGFGVKSILSRLQRSSDFSGCYVLLREGKPFYVGISRPVVQRLRQHVTENTYFDASLAYLMATDKTGHEMKRSDAMQDPAFRTAFDQAKALLRDCSVAFIDIDNPLEFYLFEAYCAMEGTLFELIDRMRSLAIVPRLALPETMCTPTCLWQISADQGLAVQVKSFSTLASVTAFPSRNTFGMLPP